MSIDPITQAQSLVPLTDSKKIEALSKLIKEKSLDIVNAFIEIDTTLHAHNRSLALRVCIETNCIPIAIKIIHMNDFENPKDIDDFFIEAVTKKQLILVEAFLSSESLISEEAFQQAFICAVGSRFLNIVKLLLSSGMKISAESRSRAIRDAAYTNDEEMLRILLESNEPITDRYLGQTIVNLSRYSRYDLIAALLPKEASISSADRSLAIYYAINSDNQKLVEWLLPSKDLLTNNQLIKATTDAAILGHLDSFKWFLSLNIMILPLDRDCMLCSALENGHQEMALFILSLDIPEPINPDYLTRCLVFGAQHGFESVFKELLSKGYPLLANVRDEALFQALQKGHQEMALFILSLDISEPIDPDYLNSCLVFGAQHGFESVFKELLSKGYPLLANVRDEALFQALEKEHQEMALFILSLDVSEPIDPDYLNTCFDLAARYGFESVFKELLKKSSPLLPISRDNALGRAIQNGLQEIALLILALDISEPISPAFQDYCLFTAATCGFDAVFKQILTKSGPLLPATRDQAVKKAILNKHPDLALFILSLASREPIEPHSLGTCVINASAHGFTKVIEKLLISNTLLDTDRERALINASEKNHFSIVQLLLANGNISQRFLTAAIKHGANNQSLKIVTELLAYGSICDEGLNIAFKIAAEHGDVSIGAKLLETGLIIQHNYPIALMLAIENNHFLFVSFILKKTLFSDDELLYAIQEAKAINHTDIITVLEKEHAERDLSTFDSFSQKQLLDAIKAYPNDVIKGWLLKSFKEVVDLDLIDRIPDMENKGDIVKSFSIVLLCSIIKPIAAVSSSAGAASKPSIMDIPEEVLLILSALDHFTTSFKDSKKLKVLLDFLIKIKTCSLDTDKKIALINKFLDPKLSSKDFLEGLLLFPIAMQVFGYDEILKMGSSFDSTLAIYSAIERRDLTCVSQILKRDVFSNKILSEAIKKAEELNDTAITALLKKEALLKDPLNFSGFFQQKLLSAIEEYPDFFIRKWLLKAFLEISDRGLIDKIPDFDPAVDNLSIALSSILLDSMVEPLSSDTALHDTIPPFIYHELKELISVLNHFKSEINDPKTQQILLNFLITVKTLPIDLDKKNLLLMSYLDPSYSAADWIQSLSLFPKAIQKLGIDTCLYIDPITIQSNKLLELDTELGRDLALKAAIKNQHSFSVRFIVEKSLISHKNLLEAEKICPSPKSSYIASLLHEQKLLRQLSTFSSFTQKNLVAYIKKHPNEMTKKWLFNGLLEASKKGLIDQIPDLDVTEKNLSTVLSAVLICLILQPSTSSLAGAASLMRDDKLTSFLSVLDPYEASLNEPQYLSILLDFLIFIKTLPIDPDKKCALLKKGFNKDLPLEDLVTILSLMPLVIQKLGSDRVLSLSFDKIKKLGSDKLLPQPFDPKQLQEKLVLKLVHEGFLDKDLYTPFIETFLTSRSPSAIFTYVSNFIDDPIMREPIKEFISLVCHQALGDWRMVSNFHRSFLTPKQNHDWQSSIEPLTFTTAKFQNLEFRAKAFLLTKILPSSKILSTLDKERIQKALNENVLPNVDSSEIVKKMCAFAFTPTEEAINLLIEELITKDEDPSVIALFESLKGIKTEILTDSEDWEDLFLSGTEVTGSCQHVAALKEFNKCLLGPVLDGKTRILCIKDTLDGPIKSRALLKIFLEEITLPSGEKKEVPCLFLEPSYPRTINTHARKQFIKQAKNKAVSLGVNLYIEGEETTLYSKGLSAPFEYEDAILEQKDRIKSGAYTITGRKVV